MFSAQIQDIFLRRQATCVLGEALSYGQNLLDSGHVPEQERRPSERLGLHQAATAGSHGRQPVVGRVGDAGEGLEPHPRRCSPASARQAVSRWRRRREGCRRRRTGARSPCQRVRADWWGDLGPMLPGTSMWASTSSREASIRAARFGRFSRSASVAPSPGPRADDCPPNRGFDPFADLKNRPPPDQDASVSSFAGVAPTPARRADDGGRARRAA